MEYTRLGSTGLQVSRVCPGMMSYGSPAWREWVLDIDAVDVELSDEEIAALEAPYVPHPILGHG